MKLAEYGIFIIVLFFLIGQSFIQAQQPARTAYDFDGDRKADLAVFRQANGFWYLNRSNQGFLASQFGIGSDIPIPADYDGDSKTDIAVWRQGWWYWIQSSDNVFRSAQYGLEQDRPTPADYDNDGRADLAVRRGRTWLINGTSIGAVGFTFPGHDDFVSFPGNHIGGGAAEISGFQPQTGRWFYYQVAGGGSYGSFIFGGLGDIPVPADYNGDGFTDAAFYRPSEGNWYIRNSPTGSGATIEIKQFGVGWDIPVPADYDGDGKADLAVYRNGIWYQQLSRAGFRAIYFGLPSDRPLPGVFPQ